MDGKTHVSHSMREAYVFQNACITHVKKRTLNAWCSIHAFIVSFLTYVLRMFYVRCTFCCVWVKFEGGMSPLDVQLCTLFLESRQFASIFVGVMPFYTQFSVFFSYMLWHIELKFITWLLSIEFQIKLAYHQFLSIFVGVMPFLVLKILEIHSLPIFSPMCFDIWSFNFVYDFYLMNFILKSRVINFL